MLKELVYWTRCKWLTPDSLKNLDLSHVYESE